MSGLLGKRARDLKLVNTHVMPVTVQGIADSTANAVLLGKGDGKKRKKKRKSLKDAEVKKSPKKVKDNQVPLYYMFGMQSIFLCFG